MDFGSCVGTPLAANQLGKVFPIPVIYTDCTMGVLHIHIEPEPYYIVFLCSVLGSYVHVYNICMEGKTIIF